MSNDNKEEDKTTIFEKEIMRLPQDIKDKLLAKEKLIKEIYDKINSKAKDSSMGFYISPEIKIENNVPKPDFDKLTINYLYDDFEKPIQFFDPKILLEDEFEKLLVEEKKKDEYNQEYSLYRLKTDETIEFKGTSISILRENCFDGIYDDLKTLGSSFVYDDSRGFISALKTIDIHRNMLLQKFEKYVVVYAGAGSWLRGEKSNDFDVFVVIDDTDVKRMPRMQVKDQLTKIIWQMSREVAQLTGIQIHIQVYLLTDFWDALKDAHPVMFTFLRDGVPFYDRGIYSAWKELLKLGKIRPSPEAIDMHMNVGTQLTDRAKKMFNDIAMNDIYYAFLNPGQAILMLKGYNPTTPKETLKIFKEVLLEKEKVISKKDYESFEEAVKLFKKLEHDKDEKVAGKDLDRMLANAEAFLENIKKMFEEISEDRTKESVVSSYNELVLQMKSLPSFSDLNDKELFDEFVKEYASKGKVAGFVKDSLKSISKAKAEYDKGKISVTEVNKVLKEMRQVLSEIKSLKDSSLMSEANKKKLNIVYDEGKTAQVMNFEEVIYLTSDEGVHEFDGSDFKISKKTKEELAENSKLDSLELTGILMDKIKSTLKAKKISL